jgi:hypothetical protein
MALPPHSLLFSLLFCSYSFKQTLSGFAYSQVNHYCTVLYCTVLLYLLLIDPKILIRYTRQCQMIVYKIEDVRAIAYPANKLFF